MLANAPIQIAIGGIIFMPRDLWDLVSEDSQMQCLYQHNVARIAELNAGARHGQEVVCEGIFTLIMTVSCLISMIESFFQPLSWFLASFLFLPSSPRKGRASLGRRNSTRWA
jgi:hypothetical protein